MTDTNDNGLAGIATVSGYLSPEDVREYATIDDIKSVANAVRNDTCVCCPGLGGFLRLECGHVLCTWCIDRGHICLACALAT